MKYSDGPIGINYSDNIGNKQTRLSGIEREPTRWENGGAINYPVPYPQNLLLQGFDRQRKNER